MPLNDTNALAAAAELILPGDLVGYHGSITEQHGHYLAEPCTCRHCFIEELRGTTNPRYRLTDPWGEMTSLRCVRRKSITPTRSA